jgi:hypothetical protein
MDPTPGAPNTPGRLHVVIDEFMYHPPDGEDDAAFNLEYLELYNPLAQPVVLETNEGAWRLNGGVEYIFPAQTQIQSKERILLVGFDPDNAQAKDSFIDYYNITDSNIRFFGPYEGKLSNRSERIALEQPMGINLSDGTPYWGIVDEVYYYHETPWPAEADSEGQALQRIAETQSGNNPQSWEANAPTPGLQDPTQPAVPGWMLY